MSVSARLVSLLVLAYRNLLSPVMPASCRYMPTCSAYALEALGRYGALRGGWLAAARICRCHPWGGSGFDPVPDRGSPTARTLGGRACPAHAGRDG